MYVNPFEDSGQFQVQRDSAAEEHGCERLELASDLELTSSGRFWVRVLAQHPQLPSCHIFSKYMCEALSQIKKTRRAGGSNNGSLISCNQMVNANGSHIKLSSSSHFSAVVFRAWQSLERFHARCRAPPLHSDPPKIRKYRRLVLACAVGLLFPGVCLPFITQSHQSSV